MRAAPPRRNLGVAMLHDKSLGAADDAVRLGRGRVEMVHPPAVMVARTVLAPAVVVEFALQPD
jgi:hypothetical protein